MSEQWKLGRFDFLPFHPAASHINPDYRDGWNHCFKAAEQLRQENKTLRGALERIDKIVGEYTGVAFREISTEARAALARSQGEGKEAT